jgi:hypothetical protein
MTPPPPNDMFTYACADDKGGEEEGERLGSRQERSSA